MCVSNTVKSSSIHHLTVNFFKFPSTQPITQQFMMTSGRFFVSANDRIMRTESLIQQNLDLNVTFSITMNNFEIHPQQLLTVSSNEEILFNASTTQFPSGRIECFWKISNGDSLLDLLTSNPVAHTTVEGYYLKINANDLLPSIPYNLEFIVRQNSSDNTILGNIMEKSFSFIMERKPKSNVIAQINGGLHEEYLPIHSYYNSRTNINSKETDFGIIQPDGSLQLISTSYDPENLPLVGFIKESFNWSCFYVKGHSYKANTIDQLRSDISSSQLQPCTETRVKTESYYNIQTSNLDYSTTYIICHDYSVGTRSDTTFIMLRTLNINEYWSVRIFPSIESMFMDPTKAIVLSGEIFPGGVVLSGITSLKWEWTVSYLGREDQEESPTLVMSSSNSVLYLEPRTLLSNEKAYSSSPNIYEFSVRAIINQQYTVNSTFRRKVASKQQDSIIDSSSDISIYPLFVGHNRPMLDEFVIELPSIISSAVSAKYDIYYSIDGNAMKLLTSSTYVKKITTWLPYSHTNQIDIHIFLQINDPFKESQNFRYWIGTKNVKFNNTDYDHLKMTLSKTHQIQQLVNMLPNITDIMEKNNMKYFDPRIIQDIYLELDKVCTTLNELYESSITFNSSYEELIREEISRIAISARDQIQTLNSSNSFALALFDHFNMDSNLIQLIVSLSKKPMYLSTISISLIVDNLLHPLLINFLKERNIFITRTIDVIDMRPIRETNNPTVEFSTLFSTYSNYFLTILDSLLSTSSANTIIVKSQVLAGFCQKWIHQLSLRLVEESAPSTAITITNNNVEISYKRDLLSSLIGAGFGEGASVSVDYSNDTREWKVNNNLLLIQLPPEIRQQSLFISDTELDSETVPSSSERNHFSNFIDASIISPLPLNITDQFVGFKIVTFKNTEGNSEILGNVMISVELLYNQQSLKLRNLKSPIEMVFFADQSVYLPNYLWMGGGCHFWNETTEEWSKEGCTTVASYSFLGNSKPKGSLITDDSNPGLNRIYCSCNHTTLFAVLKANTSDVELIQDFTNKVWGDITSCILIFIFSIGQAIFLLSIRTPHNISLKFRGFIPFFSILVLILEALINLARDGMVMNIFLTGVEIPFMDTIDGALRTVIDPLYCAMLVLYMLNIWQYYHKERFQYLMKKYQEKDEKYSIRRYVKFTSRSYLVMPCLALYAAQLVTYIILLVLASVSVLNFKLVFTIFSLLRACIIALSVLVSFSIIIFMEIFMKKVLNFNDVKTDNFLKFEGTFNGDVFLFKIEWIAYMFMASLLVLAEGYDVMNVMYPNLYSNTFNEGSLAFQLYSRQAHIHMLEIAPIILLFMVKVLILLVYGGFVACMTARKHTFCCTRGSETQNTSDSELLDVVNDPVLGPLFEFYAMKEFTLPLVYLYRQLIDIYSFEGNFHQSMFERSQHVRKIYKRFLKKYSPFPLSISRKTMRMFHIRKEQDEAITAQELEDLITILKVETTEQLMGVYWRFKQTETFKKNEKKSVVNPYLNEDL